jgi:hypothetical protein
MPGKTYWTSSLIRQVEDQLEYLMSHFEVVIALMSIGETKHRVPAYVCLCFGVRTLICCILWRSVADTLIRDRP